MWIFWAVVACLGSTAWYLSPKIFPSQNPLSPLFVWAIIMVMSIPILSKIIYKTWFDITSVPTGIFLSLSTLATVGLILALNAGGKMGPIAVIIEFSLIIATIISVIFFREQLNLMQILGIILAVIGIVFVLFFEK